MNGEKRNDAILETPNKEDSNVRLSTNVSFGRHTITQDSDKKRNPFGNPYGDLFPYSPHSKENSKIFPEKIYHSMNGIGCSPEWGSVRPRMDRPPNIFEDFENKRQTDEQEYTNFSHDPDLMLSAQKDAPKGLVKHEPKDMFQKAVGGWKTPEKGLGESFSNDHTPVHREFQLDRLNRQSFVARQPKVNVRLSFPQFTSLSAKVK
jgi:hypothetical protein